MVVGLVDTSIIVDLIRGFPAAQTWMKSQDEELGVTDYVWLEIIQGVPNKQKQKTAFSILSDFKRVEVTAADTKWAVKALAKLSLSHNVGALDGLIAAPSHRLQIPLYTMNIKHFKPLLGDLAQQSYG